MLKDQGNKFSSQNLTGQTGAMVRLDRNIDRGFTLWPVDVGAILAAIVAYQESVSSLNPRMRVERR